MLHKYNKTFFKNQIKYVHFFLHKMKNWYNGKKFPSSSTLNISPYYVFYFCCQSWHLKTQHYIYYILTYFYIQKYNICMMYMNVYNMTFSINPTTTVSVRHQTILYACLHTHTLCTKLRQCEWKRVDAIIYPAIDTI